MTLAIGVDIGGTKVAIGVVDPSGNVLTQVRRPLVANDALATLSGIIDLITELRTEHTVGAIGIGVAGLIDASRSRVTFAANLGWIDVPVREVIEGGTNLRTILDDDANAAAWGESRFGAGRNEPHLVMVTVGTGIGGGVIDHGFIRHGATGSASDIGHMQMVPGGIICGCGGRGCLEQYASGQALVREARQRCAAEPSRASALLSLGDRTPEGIRGEHLTLSASRGDPLALETFHSIAGWLGRGLAVLTSILDPGCFVVGGGVSEAGAILLDPTRAAYQQCLPARDHRVPAPVKMAELGNDAGLIGAADLARAPEPRAGPPG